MRAGRRRPGASRSPEPACRVRRAALDRGDATWPAPFWFRPPCPGRPRQLAGPAAARPP